MNRSKVYSLLKYLILAAAVLLTMGASCENRVVRPNSDPTAPAVHWVLLDRSTNTNYTITETTAAKTINPTYMHFLTCRADDPEGVQKIHMSTEADVTCSKTINNVVSSKSSSLHVSTYDQPFPPDAANTVPTTGFTAENILLSDWKGKDCGDGYISQAVKSFIVTCMGTNWVNASSEATLTLRSCGGKEQPCCSAPDEQCGGTPGLRCNVGTCITCGVLGASCCDKQPACFGSQLQCSTQFECVAKPAPAPTCAPAGAHCLHDSECCSHACAAFVDQTCQGGSTPTPPSCNISAYLVNTACYNADGTLSNILAPGSITIWGCGSDQANAEQGALAGLKAAGYCFTSSSVPGCCEYSAQYYPGCISGCVYH